MKNLAPARFGVGQCCAAKNCAAQICLATISAGEVSLGEVKAAQARVREVGRYARVRRPPRVPGIRALLQHREMRFGGHRLFRCRQSGWQPTVYQAERGGELGANQALRIPQIRCREVGAVEPCQAKVGAPKVNLSQ